MITVWTGGRSSAVKILTGLSGLAFGLGTTLPPGLSQGQVRALDGPEPAITALELSANARGKARALLSSLQHDIRDLDQSILNSPFLDDLEQGNVTRHQLQQFACDQFHIGISDLRSMALLLSRYPTGDSSLLFQELLSGEIRSHPQLIRFAIAVGMNVQDLEACEPRAGSLAYAAYLASMAMHGNQADVAGAFLINFPVFGTNAARMGRALQRPPYDLDTTDLGFFRFFGDGSEAFRESALATLAEGIEDGADSSQVRRSARLLQEYEQLFWTTVHQRRKGSSE